jgi:hypothetical protein
MVFYRQLLEGAPKGADDDVPTPHDEYEDPSRS